ncbi:MAG: hypothetical protein KJ824_07680 [Alphaproteobacteria bacterium]|nr:hypothetical protein [Alphaproteobacteria bacterium]
MTATAVVATLLATATAAQAQRRGQEAPMLVSYPTDASMTCDQLAAEIVRTAEIAGIAADNAASAESQGAMATAATSVAINGALYSGALGRVPGLGMFANAAGGMARRNAEARARAEAERVRVAEQRHTLMTGIYQGRQCGMPAAPAPVAAPIFDQVPAPAPAPAVSPAAPAG